MIPIKELKVSDSYGDDTYISATVSLTLDMFPWMYNRSMENYPWMLYNNYNPITDPSTQTLDFTNMLASYDYDYVITYIKAPECATGFYNIQQSDALSFSSLLGLIAFTVF